MVYVANGIFQNICRQCLYSVKHYVLYFDQDRWWRLHWFHNIRGHTFIDLYIIQYLSRGDDVEPLCSLEGLPLSGLPYLKEWCHFHKDADGGILLVCNVFKARLSWLSSTVNPATTTDSFPYTWIILVHRFGDADAVNDVFPSWSSSSRRQGEQLGQLQTWRRHDVKYDYTPMFLVLLLLEILQTWRGHDVKYDYTPMFWVLLLLGILLPVLYWWLGWRNWWR